MTDAFEVKGTPVPGMLIIYQRPISPEQGHGISFQIGEEVMISLEDLNERLDTIDAASRRLCFIEELPRARMLLAAKRRALEEQRRERARAEVNMNANVFRMSEKRRQQAQPTVQDQNAVAQFDARIAQLNQELLLLERRIPYLEAYIRGDRDAVERFGDEPMLEAAE